MTAKDIRVPALDRRDFVPPKGDTLEASLLSPTAAGDAFRDMLAGASAKMLAGRSAEQVTADVQALHREIARALVPRIRALQAQMEVEEDAGDLPVPDGVRGRGPAASADPPRFRPRRNDPETFTVFHEGEQLVRMPEGGHITNTRMEMTTIYEGRRVGMRIETHTTVEMNPALRSSTPALERYVVESGTAYPGTGQRKLDKSGTRRLRPTSEYRVTTTIVREAKVDRCPDASGQSHGVASVSATIRGTSAATGTGAPATMETNARGTLVGHVDDAANLVGYDLDFTVEHRTEAIGSGADFRLRSTTGVSLRGSDVTRAVGGITTAEGYGTVEQGTSAGKLMSSVENDASGPLLLAYDMAKQWWRKPGQCYELVATSGSTPARIKPGERRRVVIDARHKEEPAPPKVPVTGKASVGSLTPSEPVRTPGAGFTYVHPARGRDGSTLTFSSTSRRGIAPDLSIAFTVKDDSTISIRYAYLGFKFVESTAEDCPDMRPGGREVLTAELRVVSADPHGYVYAGPGRFSADIDGCGLTPNREDPGMVHNRGDVPGDFHGDNFLGCKVTTAVPEHAGRVRVEIDMVDKQRPNYVTIEWEPTGAPVAAKVKTGCEPAYEAGYVKQMTEEYRRKQRRQITDYDLLPRVAPGGVLREGTYEDPNGTVEGRWTFTVGKPIEIPSLVD